jgi:hypothetical protein
MSARRRSKWAEKRTTAATGGTRATRARPAGWFSATGGTPQATGTGGQSAGAPGSSGGSKPVMPSGMGGAVVSSGGASVGSAGAAGSASPFPQLPRPTTTDGAGPFKDVVKVMSTPPGGWLVYPKDIGMGGMKHPLFVFGPGGGTTPQTYEAQGHWDRYASYGFVIYVLPMSTGNGADMKKGLDWLIAENDAMASPLYQHLDTSKVCASGHSQGSITVFDFMPDPRVTTTVLISDGSFDGMGPSHLRNDTMFLCGPSQSADVAYPQCVPTSRTARSRRFTPRCKGRRISPPVASAGPRRSRGCSGTSPVRKISGRKNSSSRRASFKPASSNRR